MDALMAALVVAALAQVGDRTAWLAAILADRYRKPVTVVLAATLALAGASALAATAGAYLAPRLAPNARMVMLGLALVLQGGGAVFPAKAPDRLGGWRLGAALTSLLGLFVLAFGDGIQFVVLALAARTPVPALAAIGATIGSLAIVIPAVAMGETAWTALPLKPVRIGIGVLFVIGGIVIGLSGLALI